MGYQKLPPAQVRRFGSAGRKRVHIRMPFTCPNPELLFLGDNVFFGVGCVFLAQGARISVGDHCRIGPGVHAYTSTHPIEYAAREFGLEGATIFLPVTIGSGVWIGGGAIVLPGVTIGDRAVIGAGSVVTKDVPPDEVWVGNPARFLKRANP